MPLRVVARTHTSVDINREVALAVLLVPSCVAHNIPPGLGMGFGAPAAGGGTELPSCPVCCEALGRYGGPATLPCGEILQEGREATLLCCRLCSLPMPPRYLTPSHALLCFP